MRTFMVPHQTLFKYAHKWTVRPVKNCSAQVVAKNASMYTLLEKEVKHNLHCIF